jgi:sulfide:quinone oxidoreductase
MGSEITRSNKKLVVLGAGIGGLSVIKELNESGVPLDDLDITVVDEDFSHYLGFTLPWVMRGWRDQASVPIRPSADALSGLTTITGSVSSIDPVARTVALADSTDIAFDALVIATGARNAVDKIPGLSAAVEDGTAVHYYSADAATDAHRALRSFTGGKLVFLIASQPYRCPVAPYEGALLAADLLSENGSRAATKISVYSPEKQPMPSAGPYAGPELVALLNANNIDFYGEHSVTHINAEAKVIEFQDGAVVEFDLLVFIPPHEPALTLDGPGWIGVDAATMQTQYAGIFAIGDTTAITSPSGRPLPKAAIFAKNGAKAAAENALRYLRQTDQAGVLSGRGYCFIDTGAHTSAQGAGDFFALPHPAIHLTPPSKQLHQDKQKEEHDWRDLWDHPASATH